VNKFDHRIVFDVVYLNFYLYLCTRLASKEWIKTDLMLVEIP